MKKILFILLFTFIGISAFADVLLSGSPFRDGIQWNQWVASNSQYGCSNPTSDWYQTGSGYSTSKSSSYVTYTPPNGCSIIVYMKKVVGVPADSCTESLDLGDSKVICNSAGVNEYAPNPDPLGGSSCRDLFQKDGVAYTCNPNTNEATPIPDSNGLIPDPENPDNNIPKCNEGFEYTSMANITVGGSGESGYTSWGCSASTGSGDIPSTGDTGSGSGSSDPVTVTNPDGSTTMTMPDGTTYNTTGDGTVTVNYPDGTSTSSGGGGGSSGGSGGGGAGTGATTPTETGETGTDTPYEPLPVASSCSDSALTLQEKMLCELNQGMKNQNSEANPTNSLNNLLKDLNVDNNKTGEAINKNIKSSNDNLSLINKNINETNKNLGAVAAKQNASNVYLKNVDQNISDIKGTINDSSFSDTSTSGTLNTMKEDNEGILDSAKEAYSNLSNTYDSIKANYQSLKDFVDGKKSENSTIDISAVTLPKKQVTIFGKTLSMDCFFNQDLNTLFAPIRPFVTFMLNIFFVFISIKLFMNYALSNRGGIV